MPKSKKRKKQGKPVKKGTLRVDPNKESNISLQDLINVVAYQEYVKDGTIIAEDVETRGFEAVQWHDEDGTMIIDEAQSLEIQEPKENQDGRQ